jgi:hypothetical protein
MQGYNHLGNKRTETADVADLIDYLARASERFPGQKIDRIFEGNGRRLALQFVKSDGLLSPDTFLDYRQRLEKLASRVDCVYVLGAGYQNVLFTKGLGASLQALGGFQVSSWDTDFQTVSEKRTSSVCMALERIGQSRLYVQSKIIKILNEWLLEERRQLRNLVDANCKIFAYNCSFAPEQEELGILVMIDDRRANLDLHPLQRGYSQRVIRSLIDSHTDEDICEYSKSIWRVSAIRWNLEVRNHLRYAEPLKLYIRDPALEGVVADPLEHYALIAKLVK